MLSNIEIKQLMNRRGWTGVALAKRWGISPVWLSKIINSSDRAAHYDDAFRGLPKASAVTHEAATMPTSSGVPSRKRKKNPLYRYQGVLELGEVLVAVRDFGSMAEEGARACIVRMRDAGAQLGEMYTIMFSDGAYEEVNVNVFDDYFQSVGLVDQYAKSVAQTMSVEQVARSLGSGHFTFHAE